MTITRGCYEIDSHPSPQFYPRCVYPAQKQDQQLQVGSNEEKRRPTVNHFKQAGVDNNTNMVKLRILYKSTNDERTQTI